MKKRLSGQMTVEVSLVLPIVMMVVVSLLHISLFVHDVITIKSFAYSIGNRNIRKEIDEFESNIKTDFKRVPLFVMKASVSLDNEQSFYKMKILAKSNIYTQWIENIINVDSMNQEVQIPKNMETEIFYAYRAVSDELGDKMK